MIQSHPHQLGLLAIALLLQGCPSGDETGASPAPVLGEAGASQTVLLGKPAKPTATGPAPKAPALPPGLSFQEALNRAVAAGYVLGAGLSPLPGTKEQGAYLESWHRAAKPKAILLRFPSQPYPPRLALAQADPKASDWQGLLLDGSLELTNNEVEERVIAFVGEGGLGLMPTGEAGERWEAEGGWLLLLQPGESAELVGPKGKVILPLQGRLGESDRMSAVYVSPDASSLGLVERLPHSGLRVAHLMHRNLQGTAYETAHFESEP